MLEFGAEDKGKSVVVSVLHLPTNTLVKHSSQSEEKAFGLCIRDINDTIQNLNWVITKDKGENVELINFNGFLSLKSIDLKQIKFENWLDGEVKIMPSAHRFEYENNTYTTYSLEKNIKINTLFESLLILKDVDFEVC